MTSDRFTNDEFPHFDGVRDFLTRETDKFDGAFSAVRFYRVLVRTPGIDLGAARLRVRGVGTVCGESKPPHTRVINRSVSKPLATVGRDRLFCASARLSDARRSCAGFSAVFAMHNGGRLLLTNGPWGFVFPTN